MRVAIYTLLWDRLEYTKKTFESMYANAGYDFDHFIVDNGSKKQTRDWLLDSPYEYRGIILNRRNRGIIGGTSQIGPSLLDYGVIVKVDNDCLFKTRNWLYRMLQIFKYYKMKVVINPMITGVIKNVSTCGNIYRIANENVQELNNIGGICQMMPNDVFALTIENMNEYQLPMHYQDDGNYSITAQKFGYKLLRLNDVVVEHIDTSMGQKYRYPDYDKKRKINRTRVLDNNFL